MTKMLRLLAIVLPLPLQEPDRDNLVQQLANPAPSGLRDRHA